MDKAAGSNGGAYHLHRSKWRCRCKRSNRKGTKRLLVLDSYRVSLRTSVSLGYARLYYSDIKHDSLYCNLVESAGNHFTVPSKAKKIRSQSQDISRGRKTLFLRRLSSMSLVFVVCW